MITEVASYFTLLPGRVKRTVQIRPDLLLDMDAHGRLLGVERIGGAVDLADLAVVLRRAVLPEETP